MRTVGIIAEYNPFHLGHAWQLAQAKRLSGADAVVVVMSSVFTQRGDPAILSPHDRAKMALLCGADAVIALPAMYAVRDAQHFALAGVSLLHSLGVNAISFGCETPSLPLLSRAAQLLQNPPDSLNQLIQHHLSSGLAHPLALSRAVSSLDPMAGEALSSPNNTLAICYLRAIIRLKAQMEVFPVCRIGGYHDTMHTDVTLPSATQVRQAILSGNWGHAQKSMPDKAFKILRHAALQKRVLDPHALDAVCTHLLRCKDAFISLPNVSQGIDDRVRKAAITHFGRDQILQAAKVKRYPYARISRLFTHAALGIKNDDFLSQPLPNAAILLGFRSDCPGLMNFLSSGSIPLLTRGREMISDQPWLNIERKAWDLWSVGVQDSADTFIRRGLVIVP